MAIERKTIVFQTDDGRNKISLEVEVDTSTEPTEDDPNQPLLLYSKQNGSTVALKSVGEFSATYETSTDGTNWTPYALSSDGTVMTLNEGDGLYFRRTDNNGTQAGSQNYVKFEITGHIDAWHNLGSMNRVGDTIPQFTYLFSGCSGLYRAPLLPYEELGEGSYANLFQGCVALTKAPELPFTSFTSGSYACCHRMFFRCSELVQAPSRLLPRSLVRQCYASMFSECSKLTTPPEIDATTLAGSCCSYMFFKCSALTRTPALRAETLEDYCYEYMFNRCGALSEVVCHATSEGTGSQYNWLYGVAATGNFYCDPSSTIFLENNVSGIPQNWTRLPLE